MISNRMFCFWARVLWHIKMYQRDRKKKINVILNRHYRIVCAWLLWPFLMTRDGKFMVTCLCPCVFFLCYLFSWQQHFIIICCFLRLICIICYWIVRQQHREPKAHHRQSKNKRREGTVSRESDEKKARNECSCANKTMKHGQQISSRLEKSILDGS